MSSSCAPKVSVCVVAYNQEPYIAQCLQSLIDQRTRFDVEIIVGDDCSTDGTRRVIQQFADTHPGRIRPLFQPSNVGGAANYLAVHAAARGEYIAHLDGDDYALPGKLQMQADLLDADPDCNVVWHAVELVEPGGTIRESRQLGLQGGRLWVEQRDQINFMVIGTHSSKMYRRSLRDSVTLAPVFTDFALGVAHLENGRGVLVCDRSYGGYRLGIGVSSGSVFTRRLLLEHLEDTLRTHPARRAEVLSASLHLLLSDIKRRAPTLIQTIRLVRKAFCVAGVRLYAQTFGQRAALKF